MTHARPAPPATRPFPPAHPRAGGPPPRLRADDFRRSRFIAVMKVLLPGAAIVLLAVVAAWPALDFDDDTFRLDFTLVAPPAAEEPQMLNPRLLSIDSRRQPVMLSADVATQLSGDAEVFQLNQPKADILLADGTWWSLSAVEGVYQRERDVLDLVGEVKLFHDSGYEFGTEAARVYFERREVVGDRPVYGQGPFGELRAQGFRIVERGERILFTGKSRLTLFGGLRTPTK